jgi:cation diffusion facilitator family transporter
MLAEAIHSLADTSNQGLLIFGQRSGRRGPSQSHPFGYARERYLWAFVVSMVLFSVGGLFAMWEGFQKLFDPHEIENAWWAVGILVLGIVLEGTSFMTAVRESNKIRRNVGWAEFIRHSKSPELPVVLLEDFGALIGLVLALVGITLAVVTGNPAFDALGTIAIGALLIVIAVVLAVEMRSLIIGEAATPADRMAMDGAILDSDDVLSIIHRRTQHLGPEHILLAAKVEFRHDMTMHELADAIDAAEVRVRKQVPAATDIYIEPDVYRAPSSQADATPGEGAAAPDA